MSSLGQTLQRARVEQGLDVANLALRLKINPKYISAIEADDRASFPSAFFYKSFVHQYALALSLKVEQIDARLDQILSAEAPPPLPGQDGFPIRKREPEIRISGSGNRLRWSLALAGAILGCAGFYIWRLKTGHDDPIFAALRRAAESTRKRVVEPSRKAPGAAPSQQVLPAGLSENRTPPSGASPADDHLVLNLIAKEQTWLSVYSDGKRVYAGVLHANETKAIEGKQAARMTVGNAGGIEVEFNGKAIGALGARGQVRTVLFTRNNFQIVVPAKDGV